MDFTGFTMLPSHLRRTVATPEEQKVVGEVLERFGLRNRLPSHNKLRVELENAVPSNTPLVLAHATWAASHFSNVATPKGFPRQDDAMLTPPGIVKVSVECISRETSAIGSYHAFEGYYLSVLVSIPDRTVWDVRGEVAA